MPKKNQESQVREEERSPQVSLSISFEGGATDVQKKGETPPTSKRAKGGAEGETRRFPGKGVPPLQKEGNCIRLNFYLSHYNKDDQSRSTLRENNNNGGGGKIHPRVRGEESVLFSGGRELSNLRGQEKEGGRSCCGRGR